MKAIGKGLLLISIGIAIGVTPLIGVLGGWKGDTLLPLVYIVAVTLYWDKKERSEIK